MTRVDLACTILKWYDPCISAVQGSARERRGAMKRLLVLAAVVSLAVGLYATTAGGTQQAVTPAQFKALKAQVAKIRKDLNTTTAVLAGCVMGSAVPITRYSGY